MVLKLFNITDEPNVIGKHIGTPINTFEVTPRDKTGVLYVTLTISATVKGVNYAYLDGCYYFITNIESKPYNASVIYLKKIY